MFTRRDFIYIGIIALVVVIWFRAFFLEGKVLVPPNANSGYPWYGTAAYVEPHPQGSMDAVRENYITWALHDQYIQEGYAPYWQPYFLTGNPLLANQFAIPFSPFKLLNFLFSAPVAWSWAIVLKSFLNGLFTYLALRALARGYAASTIGALAWMLSWALAHQTQTTYSEGVAWMPAVFFLTLRSYQVVTLRRQAMYGMLAGVVAGFQFLAGNIQMTIYTFLLLMGFALYWSWDQNRSAGSWLGRLRPLWTVLAVYMGGLLVGAVQVFPSYELLGLSIRGAAQTHANRGIEPYTEISFLNPWIYFWRNFEFPELRDRYWLNYRWNPYIGLFPLLACGLNLRFVKDRVGRAILWMTLAVFILLHLVYPRPIFNLLSDLPGYTVLDQTRLLIVLMFPLAMASAYGVDWLLDHGQENWQKLRTVWFLAWLVIPIMAVGILALILFFGKESAAISDLGDSFADQRERIGLEILSDYYRFGNPLFAASFVFAVGTVALVWGCGKGWLERPLAEGLMIGLVAVDLVFFARVNIASNEPEKVYPTTPAIEFLQAQMQADLFRITTAPNTLYEGRQAGEFSRYRDDHGWYMASSLPVLVPNTAAIFGLQDIRGYESVYTLDYSTYLARLDGHSEPFGALAIPTQVISHPMLDALNVKYILSVEPLDAPNPADQAGRGVYIDTPATPQTGQIGTSAPTDLADLELVYAGEILIYENPNALPRAALYFQVEVLPDAEAVLDAMSAPAYDPWKGLYLDSSSNFDLPPAADLVPIPATITHYDPNRVVIEVDAPQDAVLMLADKNYPGWVAAVDGAETPIATANYLMRAVGVPAGQHTVEFRYQSAVIRYSLWLSLLSLVGLLVGVIATSWGWRFPKLL